MKAVLKSWINTNTDRGLQRAILLLHALAMGQNGADGGKGETSSSLLNRLSRLSSELLNKKSHVKAVDGKLEITYSMFDVEGAPENISRRQQPHQMHLAFNPMMALLNTAMTGNTDRTLPIDKESSEPIGALPHIEPSVSPDLRSFKIVVGGES